MAVIIEDLAGSIGFEQQAVAKGKASKISVSAIVFSHCSSKII